MVKCNQLTPLPFKGLNHIEVVVSCSTKSWTSPDAVVAFHDFGVTCVMTHLLTVKFIKQKFLADENFNGWSINSW